MISARDLTGCAHRLALDATAGPMPEQEQPQGVQRRIEAAEQHRDEVIAALFASAPPDGRVLIDPALRRCAGAPARRAAWAGATTWIFRAVLPLDVEHGRRGHAEILVRTGPDGGYVPIIIVNHRVSQPVSPDAERPGTLLTSPLGRWEPRVDGTRSSRVQRRDAMRLAHLTAMLGDLGCAASGRDADLRGGVIGSDADIVVVLPLAAVLADYRETFAVRRRIVEGTQQTEPHRVSECRSCRWWPRCEDELRARGAISLVIGGRPGEVLEESGIVTIAELAAYRGPEPEEWPGSRPFDEAVVSAICWGEGIDLVRRRDRPRVHRADIEVDVDMESYGERGAYLWGTLLTDTTEPGAAVRYRPFVTWDPLPSDDEARSFAEFWGWLMDQRAQAYAAGKTFAAYCYSQHAENRWLRGSADRFAGMPGIPDRAAVDAFIDSPEWVDVFEAVGDNFICPNGKGLKVVAPVAGFHWRDDEASGEASMEWYAAAVGLDGRVEDLSQRARLLEYNEDDVQATKILREWMSSPDVMALPFRDDLLAGTRDAD